MSAIQENDVNGPVTYDQKVKFQTFGYQGLPLLYVLVWFFSIGVLVDEKIVDAPPFFFVILIVSTLLLIEWWFRRRFIARNEGEEWVTVGQQLTEKYVWAKQYEISKLTFKTVKRSAGENGSINYVQLFYEGKKILDCPGSKHEVMEILPELGLPTNDVTGYFSSKYPVGQRNSPPKEKNVLTQSDNESPPPNSQTPPSTEPTNSNETEEQSSNFWDNVKVDSS
ncbi:MAG: hypothetical protein P8R00_05950 [Candidatus Poseidoniaceae archaeon]|nr:hypothetical protein [Candidatus Poseidoniaceae archaeon]